MLARREIVIIGSGFAGSILARMLRRRSRDVLLLERDRHPRFAIGESSTPLAAIALERIAERYDLPDLDALASYGRWLGTFPELRRGLKRGFSFYRHDRGRPFSNGSENENRLLVAASPRDEVGDSHWLRADVDHHLVRRAKQEGVEVWMGAEAAGASLVRDGVEIDGIRDGVPFRLLAEAVVDATGPGSFLSRCLPIASRLDDVEVDSCLVGGHFRGMRAFVEAAAEQGAHFDAAPYPEERAAVHHLLDEGWMYVLPFDHGVVSAGFVLNRSHPGIERTTAGEPLEIFQRMLGRYPSLAASFAEAEPVSPLLWAPRLQRRLARAAGPRWLLLPHAFGFVDPMFSTGIAWSLLGIERAAELLGSSTLPEKAGWAAYDELLRAEAVQIERLIAGALRAAADFPLFCAWSYLYFAQVAFAETRQRLGQAGGEALLGADDPSRRELLVAARERLEEALEAATPEAGRDFEKFVAERIEPMDVIGLADPERRHLYPVDLEALVERARRFEVTPSEMRLLLPRILRS